MTARTPDTVTEAVHRSVKASNLRAGHVLHRGGTGTAVAGVKAIPGALNGERVRADLADGTTVTLNPEDRVSVTSPVEEAVLEVLEAGLRTGGGARDKAASRLRWIKWEKSHGAYSLSATARGVEPRMLQELPDGQKLRLGDGTEVHRKGSSYDVRIPDGKGGHDTMKGKTAQQAAKQAQAMHAEHKAGTAKTTESARGLNRVTLGGNEFITGHNGKVMSSKDIPLSKMTTGPGLVQHERTGNFHVEQHLPKNAMIRGDKVHFPGDPKYKTEAQVKAQNDPVRKAWKNGKTPSGDPLPKGLHHVDHLPAGAKAKPVDSHGKTSEHNPVYTKHSDGSMRAPSGVKASDPSGTLWKHQGGPKPRMKVDRSGFEHLTGKPPAMKHDRTGWEDVMAEGKKKKIQEADMDPVEQAVAEVLEAADSMAKASTPEPFSKSKTSNWVARGGGLPAYIQHIAHDLMEKRGKSESNAIQMAIGIVKRWARGGGNVDANTRAAAAKAVAEWEALKAKSKARKAVTEAELAVFEAWIDEHAELVIQEAEELLADDARMRPIQEADSKADGDGDEGMTKGKRSDGLKVKCPGCNHRAVPKDGKCPNCGKDVSKLAAFAKRLKGKVEEAETADPLRDAIVEALED